MSIYFVDKTPLIFNDFNASEIPYYPQIRYQIDLTEKIKGEEIQGMAFTFKPLPLNYSILIQMEDKDFKCRRPLAKTAMRQFGDKIELRKETGGSNLKFYVNIHQEIFEEEDTSENCVNYPTADHDSYDHCDSVFIGDRLTSLGMTNTTPVWMTEDAGTATAKVEIDEATDEETVTEITYLLGGTKVSNCAEPCKQSVTNTKKLMEGSSLQGQHL